MRLILFCVVLVLLMSCSTEQPNTETQKINTTSITPKPASFYTHQCLPDSIFRNISSPSLDTSQLKLPIGDTAFFHDFPKSWDNNIGWTSPPIPGDSISDSLMSRLIRKEDFPTGLLFKQKCYAAYLVKTKAPNGYLTKFNIITVNTENKVIDTLNLKFLKSLDRENMTLYKVFYIDSDSIIHLKTLGGAHQAEMCFSGAHELFKVLNNGVISPYFKNDLDTGYSEKLVIGNRIIKGKTENHLPHGKWQQTEMDFNLPYLNNPKRREYYALSVAEGEYIHGAKNGGWNYYKVKSDTVVADNAYTYSYPTYQKSNEVLKREFYQNGVLISQELLYDSSQYRPLIAEFIASPKRYTATFYKNIIGRKYFANYRYGIMLREKVNGGAAVTLNYGDEVTVTEEKLLLNKEPSYDGNVLTQRIKVDFKGGLFMGNTRFFSPLPMPPDTGNSYKTTLKDYAKLYPEYAKVLPNENSFLFYDADVTEVYQFLENLKFPTELHPWLTNTPLVEGFKNTCVRKIEIEDDLVEGYETKYSADGKLYRITKLTFYFTSKMPYSKAVFVQEGENVILTFFNK